MPLVNPVPKTDIDAELPWLQMVLTVLAIGVVIVVSVLGFHAFQMRDPYIQQVMAISGDVHQGHEIFKINCAACHGAEGSGIVGPSLKSVSDRKSRIGIIHQVISGATPPMPKFQPSPEVMADLLAYLESLK